MTTKLGLQLQMHEGSADAWAIACRPAEMKVIWQGDQSNTLNTVVLDKYRQAGIPLVARPFTGAGSTQEGQFLANLDVGVQDMMWILRNFRAKWPHWVRYQVLNETGINAWAPAHAEFVRRIAAEARSEGFTLDLFNFPTGNPSHPAGWPPYESDPAGFMAELRRQWDPYLPGLYAIKEYGHRLGLNQYAPTYPMDVGSKFHILRHRMVLEVLPADLRDIEITVGETSIDRGGDFPREQRGFRSVCSEQQFADELRWLDRKLHEDVNVKVAHIFGSYIIYFDPARSFDVAGSGPVQQAIRDGANIPHIEPPPSPPPSPEPPPAESYEFTLGFATFAAAHPEVGEAAGPLGYDTWGNGLQLTTVGELRWWRIVNKITFLKHDARQ